MSTVPLVDVESNATINSVTFADRSNDFELEPTILELKTLEHISDHIPLTAWSMIFCELCEGFASYGTFQIMQNYIQFPVSELDNSQPGALGKGQQIATTMTISYYSFCNLIPIAAAVVADQYWGRFKTIVVACSIYFVGLILLVLTSIPASITANVALPGLICSMIILGVAQGGYKCTVGPFMVEQYTRTTPVVKEVKGEKKIIDPELTVQSLFNWLYWAYSLGGLVATFITTNVEKYHSFWLAYFISASIFLGCIVVLLIGRRRYIRIPPTDSLLIHAFRVISLAIKNRWKMGKQQNKHLLDYAKEVNPPNTCQSVIIQNENRFIDNLKQAIYASRVFIFFPLYWMCLNQLSSNLISQAAQMNTGPIPNDVMLDSSILIVVIFAPIFDKIVYPTLRRFHIKFNAMKRITFGFFLMALGMAWAAIVQQMIYSTGPYYNYANKPCLTCQQFNNLTVAWQIPSYFLIGISEIFAGITILEYAFSNAPPIMKSIVMSLYLFAIAIGCALNLALVPVSTDPMVLWMYVSMAIVSFVTGIIFYICFRNDNKQILKQDEPLRKMSIVSIKTYF